MVEDCDVAIKIDPTFAKSYIRKAKALHLLKKFHEALEVIGEALKLEGENADA